MVASRQVTEESVKRSGTSGVKRPGAERVELARGALKALGIPAGQNQLCARSPGSPGRFESDSGATADHDDDLSEKFRFVRDGRGGGCCAHDCPSMFVSKPAL